MSMPDTYQVMMLRRRAYSEGISPPPMKYVFCVVFPGYQPDEIARMAREVRRRIAEWRQKRSAS